mgnify:CR=1 FL=1
MNAAGRPRTVLAVGAHPNDIEMFCAGTLALLKERGWHVIMVTMTPGDLDGDAPSRSEAARIRLEQAHRSAALLAADYYCLEPGECGVFYSDLSTRKATGMIRATRPDLVLTHSALDRLADHEETSRIIRQACWSAPLAAYEVRSFAGGEKPIRRAPHLYYFDPVDGKDFLGYPVRADLIVDVTSVMNTKEQMLNQLAGRGEPSDRQRGREESLARMRRWNEQRGREVSIPYGEGFNQHTGNAYPRDNLLKNVLGDLAHLRPAPKGAAGGRGDGPA